VHGSEQGWHYMGLWLLNLALTVIKKRLGPRIQIASKSYCNSFVSPEQRWVLYVTVRVCSKGLNIIFGCCLLGLC
jgi:hypothetical protein